MIGTQYWATGITMRRAGEQWSASAPFHDNGFADDDAAQSRISAEGALSTRYFVSAADEAEAAVAAATVLKQDAERLGIQFRATGPVDLSPSIYLHRSNWSSDDREGGMPAIEQILTRVAAPLGWHDARRAADGTPSLP